MSAGTSEFFCLICFLVCSCSAQTNITAEKIPAELGQEVVLPCKVPNKYNINSIRAVEWSRPGLKPDHVLYYRDGRLDPDNQHPSYQNRVDLQDEEMKDGDVSLILKDVTMEDTGRYECRVFEIGNKDPINIVNLEVLLSGKQDESSGGGGDKNGGNKNGVIAGSVVGGVILFLLVVASAVFLIYGRHKRKNQHHPVPPVEPTPIEMSTVPGVPPEQPTASEPLMERPAEEQNENVN